MVTCVRCHQTREGAGRVLPGALGDEIERSVCAVCWAEWLQQQIRVINHYALKPALREDRAFLGRDDDDDVVGGAEGALHAVERGLLRIVAPEKHPAVGIERKIAQAQAGCEDDERRDEDDDDGMAHNPVEICGRKPLDCAHPRIPATGRNLHADLPIA